MFQYLDTFGYVTAILLGLVIGVGILFCFYMLLSMTGLGNKLSKKNEGVLDVVLAILALIVLVSSCYVGLVISNNDAKKKANNIIANNLIVAENLNTFSNVANSYYKKYGIYGDVNSLIVFDPAINGFNDGSVGYAPTKIPTGATIQNTQEYRSAQGGNVEIDIDIVLRKGKTVGTKCAAYYLSTGMSEDEVCDRALKILNK